MIRHFPQPPRDPVDQVTQGFVNRKNGPGWERLSSNIFWYLVKHVGKVSSKRKRFFSVVKGLISKLCGKTRAETCLSTRKTGVKKLTPIEKRTPNKTNDTGRLVFFSSGLGLSNPYLWLRFFFSTFQLNGSGGRMSSTG